MLINDSNSKVIINAVDTITSTDRCGPRRFKYDRTDSHVLMFRTLFNLKCGNSDLRARLDDVRCEKSLAYRNLCLNVRSATANKKKNRQASEQRSIRPMIIIVRSLQTEDYS